MRVVSQYNVNVVPRDWGVLHQMAMQNYAHRANLKRLYDIGADINIITRSAKDSPLHVAAAHGSVDFINELLLLRADHHKLNAAGKTPSDVASDNGHNAAATLLRRHVYFPDTQLHPAFHSAPPSLPLTLSPFFLPHAATHEWLT
jgi:ankyrin repeat protein